MPRPTTRTPGEIHVHLEARETEWEIAPGRTVSAWGYHSHANETEQTEHGCLDCTCAAGTS